MGQFLCSCLIQLSPKHLNLLFRPQPNKTRLTKTTLDGKVLRDVVGYHFYLLFILNAKITLLC